MPGNEFGERIHNFFGQEGLSQDQHQPQVDGSWSAFSNGLVGNQRQIDPSLVANLKNYSTQQSVDSERGQSSNSQHGMNFTQQPLRSEYSRSQLQNHQQPINGFMHGGRVLQTTPNDANFLGINAESTGHRLTTKGYPPDLHKNPTRLDMGEAPVNYDFFGGQPQLGNQFPGMLQSLPPQQMTFNDMQLLQHQVMMKQMHEFQMQQQLQEKQLQARQLNSLNQNPVNGSRLNDNRPHPFINGIPLHGASSNTWQPELMTGNANWLHGGNSPVVQGSSSGLLVTPEQGQTPMGSVQQFEPSLYGMPVTGTRASQNAFSSAQMNNLAMQHASVNSNSSLVNQQSAFLNQGYSHDSRMLPRSSYQEKVLFSPTSVQGSNNGSNLGSLQQDDSLVGNISVQEKIGDKQEASGLSEKSYMRGTEDVITPQKLTTLDPTEEKILFGSDENLWDAFGSSSNMSMAGSTLSSGSDIFGACPSLQSGSWSALMQSAVAETSSGDAGIKDQTSKQHPVWAQNHTGARGNSHVDGSLQDTGLNASYVLRERPHSDVAQTAVNYLQDKGSKVSDHGLLEKSMAPRSQMARNRSSGSGFDAQNNLRSIPENEDTGDRLGIWKAASNSNSAGLTEHKNLFVHNLKMQRENSVENAIPQLKYGEGSQILESSAIDSSSGIILKKKEMGNFAKENSNDSFRSNFSPESSSGGYRECTQVSARDLSIFPGGKQTQSGHRPSVPRKFQYHPMGDVEINDEDCGGNQGHFGQSKSIGQTTLNIQTDKGHISQGDLSCTNEVLHKGIRPDNSPSTSASIDRSVDRFNQVKSVSSRQTMLELLHKVDQSQEDSLGNNVSGFPEARTSVDSSVQLQHNQSSSSQGFSLQLAPPSQPSLLPDNVSFSRSIPQPLNSNSVHTASEKGGMSQSRFAPWSSNHPIHQQNTYQEALPGMSGQSNSFPYSRGYQQNQMIPVAVRPSSSNQLADTLSEVSTPRMKERDGYGEMDKRGHSAQRPTLLNSTSHNIKGDSAAEFHMREAISASQPLAASSSLEQDPSPSMVSGSRASISAVQNHLSSQPSNPHPDNFRSHMWPSNNQEGSFFGPEKTNKIYHNGEHGSSSGRSMMNMHELQSKDIAAKQTSETPPMFSKMEQSNLQTFGRSLISNNLSKEHLEHMAGNGEGDAHDRTVKRVKDGLADPQNLTPMEEHGSPLRSDGFVRAASLNNKESADHMPHFGQITPQSFSIKNPLASAGTSYHPQISPQMAPSWFSQYGTFKNGLVPPVNDSGRCTALNTGEKSSLSERSVDNMLSVQSSKELDTVGPGDVVHMQQTPGSAPSAEAPSSESLPHGTTDQLLTVDRPKKRKSTKSGLLSWNTEVMQGSQRLLTLSETVVDWARATYRYAEKLELEVELLEGFPLVRSKRRLVYTTQLVQQLLRPPPARVISLAASSNYETVAYTAARATLGDACSSISSARTESFETLNNAIPLPNKTKSEKISDQYISRAAEDFISRARKLETDFAGLEKGTTFPDLRVEVQDLEKFAVINRFARFHARGPLDGTETSSSTDRTANSHRFYPQRYVTIAPMPRNVPNRVQCLSL